MLNPSLYKNLAYDSQKSFAPVVLLAKQPNILVVGPGIQANSVHELVSLLKANPGKYSFGSSGNGSSQHVAGEMFKIAAGVEMQHIPYKSSGAILADLLGGHIHLAIDNISAALPMAKAGKLKALAVTSARRSAAAPELPTMQEAGIANYEMVPWHAVFAPAGTPATVIERLNRAINLVLANPETRKRMEDVGMEVGGGTPKELAQLLATDLPRMREVVIRSGAIVD